MPRAEAAQGSAHRHGGLAAWEHHQFGGGAGVLGEHSTASIWQVHLGEAFNSEKHALAAGEISVILSTVLPRKQRKHTLYFMPRCVHTHHITIITLPLGHAL